jgi:hypothetical protein
MYNNFTRNNGHSRDFFLRYSDRLIYGTDTTTGQIARNGDRGVEIAVGRAWGVRTFLETDTEFTPPEGLEHWLEPDLCGLRGIALPCEALERIYHANLERLYGPAPAPLDQEAALAEIQRMVVALDERAGGMAVHNHARRALEVFSAA